MGRKRKLQRAIEEAEAHPNASPRSLARPHPDDDKLVQVSMFVTSGDRYRLKMLGLRLDHTSLQRLGHRAWNALLASHGQPGLTPVLTGTRTDQLSADGLSEGRLGAK